MPCDANSLAHHGTHEPTTTISMQSLLNAQILRSTWRYRVYPV